MNKERKYVTKETPRFLLFFIKNPLHHLKIDLLDVLYRTSISYSLSKNEICLTIIMIYINRHCNYNIFLRLKSNHFVCLQQC